MPTVIDNVTFSRSGKFSDISQKEKYGGILLEIGEHAKYLASSFSQRAPIRKRFMIFGRGRSGSTLLVTMLDSHPEIKCLGEILRFRIRFPELYLEAALRNAGTSVVGFKFLSYQSRTVQVGGADLLKRIADRDTEIFYLRRENLFRHALSNLYAKKRSVYHSYDKGSDEKPKMIVAPEEIIHWMEGSEGLREYEAQVLSGIPHIELTYERDLETNDDQRRTYERLVSHFGCASSGFELKTSVVTPRSVDKLILNSDEVFDAVARTRFKEFLPQS